MIAESACLFNTAISFRRELHNGLHPQLHAMIYTTIAVAKFQSTDCFETLAFLFLNRCFGLAPFPAAANLKVHAVANEKPPEFTTSFA